MFLENEKGKIKNGTHPELCDVYDSGRENTIIFMQLLLERNEKHEAMIKELQEQIKQLQETISKDSHNSNKPPSSDNPFKKTKSLRKKTGKKPGGQKGHKGHTLERTANPDTIKIIKACNCINCHLSLDNEAVKGYEKRQVIDVPEIKPTTTEYWAEIKDCPCCSLENKAGFPEEATAPVQYGNNLRSIVAYLTNYGLIPNDRCAEIVNELYNLSISTGTIVNMNRYYAQVLDNSGFESKVKQELKKSKVLHSDETGVNINKELHWLHVCSSEAYTFYFVHSQRGSEAMDEMAILDGFAGTVVHDNWKSYFNYECKHALCNSHHLRELIFIEEEYEQPWSRKMQKLLLEIKEAVESAKLKNRKSLIPEIITKFERKYRRIIGKGFQANPPPEKIKAETRSREKIKISKYAHTAEASNEGNARLHV